MVDLEPKAIHSEEELSFAIFCIENVANRLGVGGIGFIARLQRRAIL